MVQFFYWMKQQQEQGEPEEEEVESSEPTPVSSWILGRFSKYIDPNYWLTEENEDELEDDPYDKYFWKVYADGKEVTLEDLKEPDGRIGAYPRFKEVQLPPRLTKRQRRELQEAEEEALLDEMERKRQGL
jgi:hypothetical protein